MNEITARRAVVEACHRAASEKLVVGTAGNASQRYGDQVAVTATGAVLGRVTEDEVARSSRATSSPRPRSTCTSASTGRTRRAAAWTPSCTSTPR